MKNKCQVKTHNLWAGKYVKIHDGRYKYRIEKDRPYVVAGLKGFDVSFPEKILVEHRYFKVEISSGQDFTILVVGKPGYAWDGPSGPTIDRHPTIIASLFHDILYQTTRSGQTPRKLRKAYDMLYKEVALKLGDNKALAYLEYYGVRLFALPATYDYNYWKGVKKMVRSKI